MSFGKRRSTKSAKPRSTKKRANAAATASAKVRPVVLLCGHGQMLRECVSMLSGTPYKLAVVTPRSDTEEYSFPAGVRRLSRPDKNATLAIEVTLSDRDVKRKSIEMLDAAFGPETLVLTNTLVIPVSEQASWISGKHRLVGVGLLPGLLEGPLIEIAPSVMTLTRSVEAAQVFFRTIGKQTEIVQDRAGLVAARVICQIINEAAFALQDDIARPEDIDTSMKLGVSYPHGPFEWAERIGIDNVVAVLRALRLEYQEERYRIAPLLTRMALGGVWWKPHTESVHNGESS